MRAFEKELTYIKLELAIKVHKVVSYFPDRYESGLLKNGFLIPFSKVLSSPISNPILYATLFNFWNHPAVRKC